MALIHLEDENLEDLINDNKILIVDFFATWCGPCKMLSPVLEEISKEVTVVKIDVDKHEQLARDYGIMSVPTLIFFKDKNEVDKHIGFIPIEKIRQIIATVTQKG